MNIPKDWSQVSIAHYQALQRLHTTDEKEFTVRVIGLFTGMGPKDIKAMKASDYYDLIESLKFISEAPPTHPLVKRFTLEDTEFAILPNLNSLTVGEILDLEEYCQKPVDNLHNILSVIYRPVLEEDKISYILEPYNSSRSQSFGKIFKQKLCMHIVNPATVFFSIIGSASFLCTTLSSDPTLKKLTLERLRKTEKSDLLEKLLLTT